MVMGGNALMGSRMSRNELDREGYSLKCHYVSKQMWWYEDKHGVDIYITASDEGRTPLYGQIGWRDLEAAVSRHQRARRKHKREERHATQIRPAM